MEVLLTVHELQTYFFMPGYVLRAVDGVSFKIHKGETLGIVGESGCGKSQTLLSIMGLIKSPPGKIINGTINLNGKMLTNMSESEYQQIRGNEMSMIFQEPMTSLNPVFNIGYQIAETLMLHRNMKKQEAFEEARKLLQTVGMSDPEKRLREYSFQLSGGLRQRVMIAMAMACQPQLMIADEPTTALDVTIQAQILRLLRNLRIDTNMATIFITHDLAVIASFTERVIVMYAGIIVEDAPVRNIFKKPLHPYTKGLLASIPVLGQSSHDKHGKRKRLEAISGSLPDTKVFVSGCKFASRCPKVMKQCWEIEPELVEIDKQHKVRCFLYSTNPREHQPIVDIEKLSELGGKHWRREYDRREKRQKKVWK